MKCPKCHFENPTDTRFCGNCGIQLPSSEEVSVSQTKTLYVPMEELSIGSIFAGRYQVLEELGRGGMGRVYKVFDKEIKEKVALKLLNPEVAADERTIERFRNELKFARKISHRNVGRMYDLSKEGETLYITMEYVPGEDLESSIGRMGPLNVGKAIFIAKQVCEGLAEAHGLGVVHRDLKPQNIMIDSDGNARIMDFGIARSLKAKGITEEGVMIGTPKYMSPEQVEGKEADKRSDIYSLGVILFEMVTGKVPFEGDTALSIALKTKTEAPPDPRELNPQIPEDLSRIILRCMKKDKEKRYQRAEEIFSELSKIEQEISTTDRILQKRKKKFALPKKREKPSFMSILRELRKRKIIETLAAFIAGGMLIIEFVHWVLIGHYHFPRQSLDITITTILCALICTLIWRWFRGVEKKLRKIKVEFLLIPFVILIMAFFDIKFFLQMGKEQIEHSEAKISGEMKWENSIAVLPFEDKSPRRDKEHICEGMTDDIITKLSRLIPQLNVMSKHSVRRYKNTEKDISEIGQELRVATILEASLYIEKNTIRVIAKLINVEGGFLLWSNTYEQELESVFKVQDEISMAIAKALKVRLVDERFKALKTREPTYVEAYEYYLKGKHFIDEKYSISHQEEDFKTGVGMFEKAVEIDPNYALAYWGLGIAYESHFNQTKIERDKDLMLMNFEKAYGIAPDLEEANLGLGWAYFYKEDLDTSYQFFKRAFEIDPNSPSTNFDVGSFIRSIGLYGQAIKYYSRYIELNPLFIWPYILCANCSMWTGEFEKAAIFIKKALEIEPDNFLLLLCYGNYFIMVEEYERAEKVLARAEKIDPQSPRFKDHLAWLLAAKGEKEKALALIKDAAPYNYRVTYVYSLLGMKDEAIKYINEGIEKSFKYRSEYLYSYPFLKNNPSYDNLRDDPRFKEIVKREKKKYGQKLKKYGEL